MKTSRIKSLRMALFLLIMLAAEGATAQVDSLRLAWQRRASLRTVSMIRLICEPRHFDGQQVAVTGILRIEEEDIALYFSETADSYFQRESAIALLFGQEVYTDFLGPTRRAPIEIDSLAKYNGQVVTVQGILDMSAWIGPYAVTMRNVDVVVPRERVR